MISFQASATATKVDSVAVMILDRMSYVIGELSSCHLSLTTQNDVIDPGNGLVSHFGSHQIYFDGSDRMLTQSYTDKGHRATWYNGETLIYFSYDENNYAVIETPPTSLETIETINENFGIEFPASDFFYPTFTDDLINCNDQVVYVGNSVVDGKDCFHILASNSETVTQLWIANDAIGLPVKMMIKTKKDGQSLEYEATYTDWEINPELPLSIFEFTPPPGARAVAIQPKNY